MYEITPTLAEETDLMIKWIGRSLLDRCVCSVKTSNASKPAYGLLKVWERLDNLYGSPERIENSLRHKLRMLPRISYKVKIK